MARDVGASAAEAFSVWNEIFLPRVRVIDFDDQAISDPRIDAVRERDPDDAPTAALAVALAPCLLLTDNRDDFLPLGLAERPVNDISLDIWEVSQLVTGANGAMMVTGLTGVGAYEGAKKVVETVGRDGAILIGLLLVGAAYLWWKSEPGGRFREGAAALGREAGPPLMKAVERGLDANQRVSAMAIQPADDRPSGFRYLAQRLAVGQTTMTTTEIARFLRDGGYRFKNEGDYRTLTRSWLAATPMFFELQRGHWSLGYHALPAAAD